MEKIIILQGLKLEELLKEIDTIVEKKVRTILIAANQESKEQLLTRKQVAKHLHISLPTLHYWTSAGFIPSHKIGSRVLYKSKEIERLLDKSERKSLNKCFR